MYRWILYQLVFFLLAGHTELSAMPVKQKERKKKVEQAGKYEKLFQGKQYTTASTDFITLHKVEGKLYVELPLNQLDKEMLLVSTVSKTSDNLAAVCGYSPGAGLYFRFTLQDSTVQMRQLSTAVTVNTAANESDESDGRMQEIIRQGYADPVIYAYKVLAYNRDSSAVVFDVTSLFTTDIAALSPIVPASGQYRIRGKMEAGLALLGDLKACGNNITVNSSFSYKINAYLFVFQVMKQVPLSVEVTRTLMALPEEKMPARLADARVGTFLTEKKHIPADGQEIRPYAVVRRWRIEPKDREAFRQGELTEPVKPIMMYLDDQFPESWKQPIKKGILRWNRAFEKIGFKNVIQVRDFPREDSTFDPNNLTYSCIRYLPFSLEEAVGTIWTDPATGEILNARILFFHDVLKAIHTRRFVQTAQLDTTVRNGRLPEAVLAESLEQMAARAMGNCLGLMENRAASHAWPVDSLRSATFTQRYGTASSIMDKVPYNYIAQPADRGVRLTPPDLGAYDEFMIKWLYAFFPDSLSMEEEARILATWVDEKAGDPCYRYGKQQWTSAYDPSAIDEDLGNDALQAGDYGIANLRYILSRMNDWITDDAAGDQRKELYEAIVAQFERYLNNAIYQVGGIYLNEVKDGTAIERHRPLARELQKASVNWVLRQLRESDWLDNRELLDKFPLNLPEAWKTRARMVTRLLNRKSYVALSAHLSAEPYTMAEFMDDIYIGIWQSVLRNEKLTRIDKILQTDWLDGSRLSLERMGGRQFVAANLAAQTEAVGFTDAAGYDWQEVVPTRPLENDGIYYYKLLRECRQMLQHRLPSAPEEDRPHYRAMLLMIEKILEGNQ